MLATTVAGGKLLKAARPVTERSAQPPLEPASSGSTGEVRSPGATGQVIPLDRARIPRNPPPSPAAQPLSSVDEQPLAATGTDGGPVLRHQAAPGNRPTVASLEPPGQGAKRDGAPPPPPPPLGSNEHLGGSGPSQPTAPPRAISKPMEVGQAAVPRRLGGAYKDVVTNGKQAHHMPSKKVSPLSEAEGPAIRMDPLDHQDTISWGNSREAQIWRARQKALIDAGKFREAQMMDIEDVRSKFGSKYDDAIKQMVEYTEGLPADKLRPSGVAQ